MVLSKKDLEDIGKIIEEKITASFKNEDFIKNIVEIVNENMENKYGNIISKQVDDISSLKNEIAILKKDKNKLEKTIDDNQQYSRGLNVRIFGVPKESEQENTRQIVLKLINDKMNIKDIKTTDINKCHRVQAKNPGDKPPAIVVGFNSDYIRAVVMKNRKLLKSTGISINDDLTKHRLSLFGSAVEKFSRNNVWCYHGNVFVKFKNVVHKIQDAEDIGNVK